MKELPVNQIVCGDCLEVMKGFPEESIDCVVTDPPYGIGFMGKDWDKALPSKQAFIEMFRVLKPGALAFVMSSPRQDVLWRMLRMLEECEFVLKQSFISWIYKTGFPKAYDVSKGIDKKPFTQHVKKLKIWLKKQIEKCPKTKKQINEECGFTATSYVRIDGKDYWTSALPTQEKWAKMKEVIGFTNEFDWVIKRNVKERGFIKPTGNLHKGSGIGIQFSGDQLDDKNPISPLAKKWEGWKSITGLKPALECILMVNKPLSEKTIVGNVLKHGTGAINVDACRIPAEKDLTKDYKSVRKSDDVMGERVGKFGFRQGKDSVCSAPQGAKLGRFPANLLISDKTLDLVGRQDKGGGHFNRKVKMVGHTLYEGGFKDFEQTDRVLDEGGNASRYFDLDAWAKHHGFLDVPKASKSEREKGLQGKGQIPQRYGVMKGTSEHAPNRQHPHKNIHPTVKPIKLMAYLIELGCPPDGIVLDPFVGSGTTCIAAEKLGRKWIGIDDKLSYVEIAKARLSAIPKKLDKFLEVENHADEGE